MKQKSLDRKIRRINLETKQEREIIELGMSESVPTYVPPPLPTYLHLPTYLRVFGREFVCMRVKKFRIDNR